MAPLKGSCRGSGAVSRSARISRCALAARCCRRSASVDLYTNNLRKGLEAGGIAVRQRRAIVAAPREHLL